MKDLEKRIAEHIKVMDDLKIESRKEDPQMWTAFEEGIRILLEGQLEILKTLKSLVP